MSDTPRMGHRALIDHSLCERHIKKLEGELAQAYRRGQERMRERCASHADTYGLGALAAAIRALPVEE